MRAKISARWTAPFIEQPSGGLFADCYLHDLQIGWNDLPDDALGFLKRVELYGRFSSITNEDGTVELCFENDYD